MEHFTYGKKEMDHLRLRCKKLGRAIDEIGVIKRKVTPNLFQALARSIVGQQISTKAADTVYMKLKRCTGGVTPKRVLSVAPEVLQRCGMSHKKVGYLLAVARAFEEKKISRARLNTYSNQQVIETLTALPGIGVWTAEMILIFCLRRMDVMSYGDLGIRRGLMRVHGLSSLDKEQFARYQKRYTPYGSVASLYLWEVGNVAR